MKKPGSSPWDRPAVDPIYFQTYQFCKAKKKQITDPTSLIVVDEADRLQINSLEQMRSIFDDGHLGMMILTACRNRESNGTLSAVLLAHRLRA